MFSGRKAMIPVPFKGQLTEDDYRKMNGLALRRSWKPIAIAVGLVLVLTLLTTGPRQSFDPWTLVAPLIGIVLYAVTIGPIQRRTIRRYWTSNKLLQQPVNGSISEEGIVWNVEGVSMTKFSWSLLLGYRESESLVVVYQGVNQVLYFFREYFENEVDWTEFKSLVARHLPCKK